VGVALGGMGGSVGGGGAGDREVSWISPKMPVMTAAPMVAMAPIHAILASCLGLSSANFSTSPHHPQETLSRIHDNYF
jgi:hypothetical protein